MPEELLLRCREVSEGWLTAWGCEVRHFDFCVLARHPDFRDYNAIYDLQSPGDIDRALDLASREFQDFEGAVTIYVPESQEFRAEAEWLVRLDFRPVLRSQTIVSACAVPPGSAGPAVELAPVTDRTLPRWIELYQRNFAVQPASLAADAKRWTHLYESEPAAHWFFVEKEGRPSGTAQFFAPGNGCCGIYALSLAAEDRGLQTLRGIYQQLVLQALHYEIRWLCFDRLRPASRWSGRKMKFPAAWGHPPWVVVSSEVGYRRSEDENYTFTRS